MSEHTDQENKLHIETLNMQKQLQDDEAKGITSEMLRQDLIRRRRRLLGLPMDDDNNKPENKKSNSDES